MSPAGSLPVSGLPVSGLKDKVVVITGGGRGIGKSIAAASAAAGARVLIAARSDQELRAAAREIREGAGAGFGSVEEAICDVSDESQVAALFARADQMADQAAGQTGAKTGALYGLICAAGIYGPIGTFEENSFDEWAQAVEINLIGTARCVHHAIGRMKRGGGGRIILFSGGGQGALPNFTSYVTGKGGIWRLTETLGAELAPAGIYVNAISPGAVNTKFLDELLAAGPEKVGTAFYQKSIQQRESGGIPPEKAADLALYLLSGKSAGLYGKNLSAVWDRYQEIADPKSLSATDLYTMRRVVTPDGRVRE